MASPDSSTPPAAPTPTSTGRQLRVALEVWSSDSGQLLATGRRAEQLGFDALYYGESPTGLNLDCWTALAALATTTERIRVGPVITNVVDRYRSLVLLAKQAATVAQVSGGRLDFRTGVGAAGPHARPWWEPFGIRYPAYDDRLAALTEALDVLPRWWAGEEATVAGGGPVALGLSCPAIPVTVSATGDRARRLAWSRAQVWETSFRTPAELAAEIERAGNDRGPWADGHPDPVEVSLEIDGFVATSAAGVDEVRQRAVRDRPSEDLGPVFDRALVGQPAQVAERIAELAAAGADQLVVALHDPHDEDALAALAEAATLAAGDRG